MCWNEGVFVEMLVVGDGRGGALVPTLPSADLLLVKLVHVQPWLAMSTASLFTLTMTYCQKWHAKTTHDVFLTFSRYVDHCSFSSFFVHASAYLTFFPLLPHAVYLITFDPLPNFSDTTLVNVRRRVSVKQTSITCLNTGAS